MRHARAGIKKKRPEKVDMAAYRKELILANERKTIFQQPKLERIILKKIVTRESDTKSACNFLSPQTDQYQGPVDFRKFLRKKTNYE
jgi:hypothetical protein